MGVGGSVELAKPFSEILKWPRVRIESVLKNYQEGDYDFGIDTNAVMNITGYEMDDAKELLSSLSKNDSGIINAITLLIVVLSLGCGDVREEMYRFDAIFDLMDFNKAGRISFDEMTILLLCIGSAYSFILEGKPGDEKQLQHEQAIMQFAKGVYEGLGNKRVNTTISKEEFGHYVKENFFNQGHLYVNDIFGMLTGPMHADGGVVSGDGGKSTTDSPVRTK